MKLKGLNIGGWLLMEGYILGGRNLAESVFKEKFQKKYGKKALGNFVSLFRDNFIDEEDFKNISSMGAQCIRLPFNYSLLEKKPFSYSEQGFSYLKKVFGWARAYNIGVILDLHAAPGSQNCDWHSDSRGRALFWEKQRYRQRAILLWEAIASRFKTETALIGYDILNEPVLGRRSTDILKRFYRDVIRQIRSIDKKRLIFLEGDMWAQRIEFLKELVGTNICVSIHAYQPLNYTLNFSPFYKFPGEIDGLVWDKERIRRTLEPYFRFSSKHKVKIFVGEFGINWRGGCWGESQWLQDVLELFEEFNFSYTYWTYKAIANSVFPDGIYQYIHNSPYINREGPFFGWETYLGRWKNERRKIGEFWQTKNFVPNKKIIGILKKYFRT
ncbi:MAG: cellulase family glycosylhydrolase [Candidatus Omnitrophota bacterium]|nr:MAG: cellulase family glycosylhydrolase [Candidatus Omnitrophota bacterium]